jgi:hypothetical protein
MRKNKKSELFGVLSFNWSFIQAEIHRALLSQLSHLAEILIVKVPVILTQAIGYLNLVKAVTVQ